MTSLLIATSDGRQRDLAPGRHSIGRAPENDLTLADDTVSGFHAQIIHDAGQLFIVDLGSRNGTRVNGKPVSGRVPLAAWDRINMGNTALEIVDPAGQTPTRIMPGVSDAQMQRPVQPSPGPVAAGPPPDATDTQQRPVVSPYAHSEGPISSSPNGGFTMAGLAFWPTLLHFQGRINRRQFWLYLLVPMIVGGIINVLGILLADQIPAPSRVWLPQLAVTAICLWPALAIFAKRLHDRNRSSWWTAIFVMGTLLNIAAAMGSKEMAQVLGILVLILGFIQLWLFIECGFLHGTRGNNRFGSDPLGSFGHATNATVSSSGERSVASSPRVATNVSPLVRTLATAAVLMTAIWYKTALVQSDLVRGWAIKREGSFSYFVDSLTVGKRRGIGGMVATAAFTEHLKRDYAMFFFIKGDRGYQFFFKL